MKEIYRRYLPHLPYPEGIYFITFRLVDSLPIQKFKELQQEQELLIKKLKTDDNTKLKIETNKLEKLYFEKYDQLLDNNNESPIWLKEDKIAKVVADKLHSFDNLKYDLICYCIMPNHVHLMFSLDVVRHRGATFMSHKRLRDESRTTSRTPTQHKEFATPAKGTTKDYVITDIMRLIKGSTARECNKLLNRTGEFWQHESYDHLVRDKERETTIRYILENPVKAGLVTNWQDWKWNYCNPIYL